MVDQPRRVEEALLSWGALCWVEASILADTVSHFSMHCGAFAGEMLEDFGMSSSQHVAFVELIEQGRVVVFDERYPVYSRALVDSLKIKVGAPSE